MITFFSVPKAFKGHIGTIQTNAIRSWKAAVPDCEIMLFGDDEGIASAAQEVGAIHFAQVEKNEYGTPFLDTIFIDVGRKAGNDLICYVNCDIIFTPDLVEALKALNGNVFLGIGRRLDADVTELIDLSNKEVFNKLAESSRLCTYWAIDYFIFDRRWEIGMPRLLVGRAGWDNWMVFTARMHGVPVIDLTGSLKVFHQNHDHRHVVASKGLFYGPESDYNLALVDHRFFSIFDSDHVLFEGRIQKKQLRLVQKVIYRILLNENTWAYTHPFALLFLKIKGLVDAVLLRTGAV